MGPIKQQAGRDAIVAGRDVTINNSTSGSKLPPEQVEALLSRVMEEIGRLPLSPDDQEAAQANLKLARRAAKQPDADPQPIAERLRDAVEVVKQAGLLATAAGTLGPAFRPLGEWLGRTLEWFGF